MRKLTKALTVVSLLAPVSAYSLGIGDIRVRSALNQNLNAEIPLIVSKGENPASIKVNLAPADKFDEAGVSWTYFLSKIRFSTVVKPNGNVVVKITSREALKEPYLNFLVEVSSPKGTLYREFTVLVDPPAEYQEPAYPVASTYESYPSVQEEYVPRRPKAARPAAPRVRRAPVAHYGGQIVTRRNDTLWKVAERARGGGISVEQMMIAIYEKNPHAFFQPNVNALSARKTIKIPQKDEAQRLSRQEALAEFDRQNEAWRTHTVPAAAETQVAPQETVDSQLKLVAPTEGAVGSGETVTPSSEQAAGAKTAEPAQAAAAPAGQQPGAEAGKEKATAAPSVDPALQSKVEALEKQLKMMQELIVLKDKQLAQMQQPGATPSPPSTIPQVTPPQPQPAPVEPPKTEQIPPVVTPQPGVTPPAQPVPTPPVTEVKPVQPVAPPKPVVKPAVKPAPPSEPVQEPDSTLFWTIGGLGTALLGLFGWLWWRKQQILKETDAESMFRNYSVMRGKDLATDLSMHKTADEGSFLNEFKSSDFETFESFNVDHGDIDPVAEADVYLAYGRYQQAEELIRQAIKDTPGRDECKLKLLEIFRANSSKEEFEKYAQELAGAGKKEDKDFWSKVVEMAKDVCPESALFAASSTAAVFDPDAGAQIENVLLTTDTTPPASEGKNHGAATFELPDDDDSGNTFGSHGSVISEQPQPPHGDIKKANEAAKSPEVPGEEDFEAEFGAGFEERIEEIKDEDALDFDLGLPGASIPDEIESISFDFDPDASVKPAPSKPDSSINTDDLESYEFNFDSLKTGPSKQDFSEKVELKDSWDAEQTLDFTADSAAKPEAEGDDEPLDFKFDFDMPEAGAEKRLASDEDDFMVSDLTDMDELETKLDLAKAYIDMGDAEAAKEIIGQVLEKGSDEQKQAAKKLMEELT